MDPKIFSRTDASEKHADEEKRKDIAALRHRINLTVGQAVMALAMSPRYRHQSLADLQSLLFDPLIRNRVSVANVSAREGAEVAEGALVGVAFWATVSDPVDKKISEQIEAGVFPVRLKPEEWASGDKTWLLDIVAPSRQLASAVLANFQQVAKGEKIRIHPAVARMVDPELLKKMGAHPEAPDGRRDAPG